MNIEYNHNLAKTSFSKAEFGSYVKLFLKNLTAKLTETGKADRVDALKKGATEFVKSIIANFDQWEFYTGASESLDGSIAFSFWENEEASGPVFYFFKDSLKEIKC